MIFKNWKETPFAPHIAEIGENVVYFNSANPESMDDLMAEFLRMHRLPKTSYFITDKLSFRKSSTFQIGEFLAWATEPSNGNIYIAYHNNEHMYFCYHILIENEETAVAAKLKFTLTHHKLEKI